MTGTPATTPETRILESMGIESFGNGVSCQYVGTAYVVNTHDMRIDFDRDGRFVSMQYIGNDDQFVITNSEEFDWDKLDS